MPTPLIGIKPSDNFYQPWWKNPSKPAEFSDVAKKTPVLTKEPAVTPEIDLSFLPVQPRPEAYLSLLPEEKEEIDLSFLPVQPKEVSVGNLFETPAKPLPVQPDISKLREQKPFVGQPFQPLKAKTPEQLEQEAIAKSAGLRARALEKRREESKFISAPKQFAFGALSGAMAGLPALAGELSDPEGARELEPQGSAEMFARAGGEFVGFIGGVPLKIAKAAVTRILPKIAGETAKRRVLRETAEMGLASLVAGNEQLAEVIRDPSWQSAANAVANKGLSLVLGAKTGAQFGLIRETFDRFAVRALLNLAFSNATNSAVHYAQTGEAMPPWEDVIFTSLLDVWGSVGKRPPTNAERVQVQNLAKELAPDVAGFIEGGKIKGLLPAPKNLPGEPGPTEFRVGEDIGYGMPRPRGTAETAYQATPEEVARMQAERQGQAVPKRDITGVIPEGEVTIPKGGVRGTAERPAMRAKAETGFTGDEIFAQADEIARFRFGKTLGELGSPEKRVLLIEARNELRQQAAEKMKPKETDYYARAAELDKDRAEKAAPSPSETVAPPVEAPQAKVPEPAKTTGSLGEAVGEFGKAMGELFKADPNQLNMGFGFSEKAYGRAKDHVERAWKIFEGGGKRFVDLYNSVEVGLRPYVYRFGRDNNLFGDATEKEYKNILQKNRALDEFLAKEREQGITEAVGSVLGKGEKESTTSIQRRREAKDISDARTYAWGISDVGHRTDLPWYMTVLVNGQPAGELSFDRAGWVNYFKERVGAIEAGVNRKDITRESDFYEFLKQSYPKLAPEFRAIWERVYRQSQEKATEGEYKLTRSPGDAKYDTILEAYKKLGVDRDSIQPWAKEYIEQGIDKIDDLPALYNFVGSRVSDYLEAVQNNADRPRDKFLKFIADKRKPSAKPPFDIEETGDIFGDVGTAEFGDIPTYRLEATTPKSSLRESFDKRKHLERLARQETGGERFEGTGFNEYEYQRVKPHLENFYTGLNSPGSYFRGIENFVEGVKNFFGNGLELYAERFVKDAKSGKAKLIEPSKKHELSPGKDTTKEINAEETLFDLARKTRVSGTKNLTDATKSLAQGLKTLFSDPSNLSQLNAGFAPSEEAWGLAKYHFDKAYRIFKRAGVSKTKFLKELDNVPPILLSGLNSHESSRLEGLYRSFVNKWASEAFGKDERTFTAETQLSESIEKYRNAKANKGEQVDDGVIEKRKNLLAAIQFVKNRYPRLTNLIDDIEFEYRWYFREKGGGEIKDASELVGEADLGAYDTATNKIIVMDFPGRGVKDYVNTIVHELTHAWQEKKSNRVVDEYVQPEKDYIKYREQFVEKQAKTRGALGEKAYAEKPDAFDVDSATFYAKKGLIESIKGIKELFTPGGELRSGIGPSEEGYRKALPHFHRAWGHYRKAGEPFEKFVANVLNDPRVPKEIRPYLMRFQQEQQGTVMGEAESLAKKQFGKPLTELPGGVQKKMVGDARQELNKRATEKLAQQEKATGTKESSIPPIHESHPDLTAEMHAGVPLPKGNVRSGGKTARIDPAAPVNPAERAKWSEFKRKANEEQQEGLWGRFKENIRKAEGQWIDYQAIIKDLDRRAGRLPENDPESLYAKVRQIAGRGNYIEMQLQALGSTEGQLPKELKPYFRDILTAERMAEVGKRSPIIERAEKRILDTQLAINDAQNVVNTVQPQITAMRNQPTSRARNLQLARLTRQLNLANKKLNGLNAKLQKQQDRVAKLQAKDTATGGGLRIKNPEDIKANEAERIAEGLYYTVEQNFGRNNRRLIEKAVNDYYEYNKKLLEWYRDQGMLSDTQLQDILAKNKKYSPRIFLQYFQEELAPLLGTGRGVEQKNTGIKGLKQGSIEPLLDDPLYAMAIITERLVTKGIKNRAGRVLVEDYVSSNDPSFKGIVDPWKDYKVITQGGVTKYIENPAPSGKEKFHAYSNGEKKTVVIPKEYAEVLNKSGEAQNAIVGMMELVTNSIRLGATHYNLIYGQGNPFRDLPAYNKFLRSKELPRIRYWTDVPIAYVHALHGYVRGAGKDALVKRFYENYGGASTQAEQFKIGRVSSARFSKYKEFGESIKEVARVGEKVLGALPTVTEVGSKLAAFRRLTLAGFSDTEAAWLARQLLDFSRGGSVAKGISKGVPFFSGSIQGWERNIKTFINNFERFKAQGSGNSGAAAKAYGKELLNTSINLIGPMGAMLGSYALATAVNGWSNDDYKRAYDRIYPTDLDNAVVFITGEKENPKTKEMETTYLKYPLPEFMRPYWRVIRSYMEAAMDVDDPENSGKVMMEALIKAQPIQDLDRLIPEPFKTITELALNYSFFRRREIVPQSRATAPPEEQIGPKTSPTVHDIAKVFQFILPRNAVLDVFQSPEKLEYGSQAIAPYLRQGFGAVDILRGASPSETGQGKLERFTPYSRTSGLSRNVQEIEKAIEGAGGIMEEETVARLRTREEAKQLLKSNTPAEALRIAKQREDEPLRRAIVNEMGRKGKQDIDYQITSRGLTTTGRARVIAAYMKKLPQAERLAELERLQEVGILTENVRGELEKIYSGALPQPEQTTKRRTKRPTRARRGRSEFTPSEERAIDLYER